MLLRVCLKLFAASALRVVALGCDVERADANPEAGCCRLSAPRPNLGQNAYLCGSCSADIVAGDLALYLSSCLKVESSGEGIA